MSDEAVLTEVVENVLVITLNRPEARNAINTEISLGLRSAFERLDANDDLRVGVLAGSGDTFCAGMDLKEFARSGTPKGVQSLIRDGATKPLIAAIEGKALGGGLELALMADLLVAASDAVFGLPEVRVGLFAGAGALYRLPHVMPTTVVAELAFTGEPITADRARELGLLARLAAPGAALEEGLALAAAVACNAPLGVAASKKLIRASRGTTPEEFWPQQRELVLEVFNSEDAREGAQAFAERRVPEWRNC